MTTHPVPDLERALKRERATKADLLFAVRSIACNLALAQREGRDIGGYGRMALAAADAALAQAERQPWI